MNPFFKYGETATPRRRKQMAVKVVRSEREAPMVPSGADKALAERSKQQRRANRWNKAQQQELLAGKFGFQVMQLMDFLKQMELGDGNGLLRMVDDFKWFANADLSARAQILGLIDDAIIELRICNGYPPIDDALPGEPLTIFQIVKQKLIPEEVQHAESHLGPVDNNSDALLEEAFRPDCSNR